MEYEEEFNVPRFRGSSAVVGMLPPRTPASKLLQETGGTPGLVEEEVLTLREAVRILAAERDDALHTATSRHHLEMEKLETTMRNLTTRAFLSQQEAERRAERAEKLLKDVTVGHEVQKTGWIALNTSMREQVSRLMEDARAAAKSKRRLRGKKKEDDDLEESAKSAMQQADLIRAVVTPMEAEITELKRKLVKAQKRHMSYEMQHPPTTDSTPVSPLPDSAFEVFKSTTTMTALKEVQQDLRAERQRRAEDDIQRQLKETEHQVLVVDHENLKVVYEGEKLAARDGKVAFDALGAKFMATIRELQQHCAQLEAQTSGPQPTSPTPVSDGKAAAVLPTGDESADAHAARPSSHVASAIDHLTQMTQSLQVERTAVHRAGAHDWKLQRSRLVSEIKALGMNFEAAKRRIGTLEETVSDLNAAALKPCDYCADYEYKVVTMQEEVRVAEQTVRETELQVNKAIEDVQHRVDEATLRNSRHLKLSMDDLETRMAEKSHAQLSAQDEQYTANASVIMEAMNKQAQSIKGLEDSLTATFPKVQTQTAIVAALRTQLFEANDRAAAATKRHNETLEAQAAVRDQNRIILLQYKEERDSLREQIASLRGSPRGGKKGALGTRPWWYWQEDLDRRLLHPAGWVVDDGFVAFPSAVSSRIEADYAQSKGTAILTVSLAPAVLHTDRGVMLAPIEFELDLGKKTQRNLKTGEVRAIARRGAPPGAAPKVGSPGRPGRALIGNRPRAQSAATLALPKRTVSSPATIPKSPGRSSAPILTAHPRTHPRRALSLSNNGRSRSFSDPPPKEDDAAPRTGLGSLLSSPVSSPLASPLSSPLPGDRARSRSRSRGMSFDEHFVSATNV